ncbi:MAG: diguanylate cyclase domain-containing protein [Vulcanimicrobiaceae bacterium]
MHDQALVWNTDTHLQVTSLTARLRNLAGIGGSRARLSVSDLWGSDDPLGIAVVAHHWALDGESLAFEATIRDTSYQFELEPLHDTAGGVVGVVGRAVPSTEVASKLRSDVVIAAERSAGIGTWSEDLRTGGFTISEGLATLLSIDRKTSSLELRDFDHPDEREATARSIAQMLRDENSYSHDHRILCEDGRIRTVRERVRTLYDDRGLAFARIGTLVDITEFKQREAELAELAHYDALTRLPNRTLLEERLIAAVARCERHDLRCAVLFIDLDDFKHVNDTYGHAAGDRMINRIGEHLTRYVRATDTVARLGGDEFVVLLEDLMSDEAALDAARKILRSFDHPFTINERPIAISASVGIATYPRCAHTPSELIDRADREMYTVKKNGGRGVKLADPIQKETAPIPAENAACLAFGLMPA